MKKKICTLVFLLITSLVTQAQLSRGSWQLELNTGSNTTGNTSFHYSSIDGTASWNAGIDMGYFIEKNLALKIGVGYGNNANQANVFSYKLGIKYYLFNAVPIGADFTGTAQENLNKNFFGVQGGYAIFLIPRLSLEPTVRYNISLDTAKASDELQFLLGFVFHI